MTTEMNEPQGKRVDLTGFPVSDSVVVVPWRGKTLHVRPLIEPEETMEIVNDVMSACYNEKDDAVVPEMRDFAFRACVITRYSDVFLPKDLREQYKIVYLTDLYDTIEKRVSKAQIETMRSTVEHMLFHRINQ